MPPSRTVHISDQIPCPTHQKCEDVYPIRVKKDVHEIILEFIRSRPPLQPANNRILSAPREKLVDPREQLLEDIRTNKPKLRPTPGRAFECSRSLSVDRHGNQVKKVIKPDLSLLSFGSSDNEFEPLTGRHSPDDDKNKVSVLELAPLTPLSPKSPPKHLPWQHTALDLLKITSTKRLQRRHSITVCETPRVTKNFPFKNMASTVECLSLTVEEVMHIRGVLTKAELECASINPELHLLLESGKVCFSCKKVKFSIFGPWPTKCKFCCRNVCSQCSSKMRIPTEHFEHIPVYTLNPCPSSPLNSMDMRSVDNSLTGSAPSSPEREIPLLPSSGERGSRESGEKRDRFQKIFSVDKSKKTQSSRSQQPVESSASATRNLFQRSQTVRPFSAAVTSPSGLAKSRILEGGPLMNVCSDCRSMVVSIIRASRRCLALLGHRGAQGRAERAYSACPSSRRSFGSAKSGGDVEGSNAARHVGE